MNGLLLLGLAALILVVAYLCYGRYLVKTWGIDPNATTPAVAKEDGVDYVPTNKWTVFAHQFSSIAGAGPVTGAIQAAVFGWVPVLLWIILGGIFFGAVTDFGALYASVKNEGKSMGLLIEKYIGKTGRKLFLLFCWLFTLIVIAAFADMVAGTFNAYTVTDGVASLAENAHDAPLEIQIDGLQFDEFGNAHTRGVQQLQHGPIPEPELAGGVRRVEQPDDLILRQHVGQEGREFGRVDEGGRVGGQFPPFDAPCEETAQGRNAPRERAGRVAAFAQPSDEQRDVFVV